MSSFDIWMYRCQLFCHNQGICLNEYMQVAKHQLFHDRGFCLIETSPMICSENPWTGRDLHHERFTRCSSSSYTKSLFLHVKHDLLFLFLLFFYLAFLSRIFMVHRTASKGGCYHLISFLHLHLLHRHLDISWVIAAESSPLCIA